MFARKSIYFVLPLIALVMMACGTINIGFDTVRGSGNLDSEEREVSGFDKVSLSGSGDLYIVQGEDEGLTIEAEDNLMEYITSEVRGDELVIGIRDGVSIQSTRTIRYTVRVRDLSEVSVSGSGDVFAESLTTDGLTLNISGSGDVDISDLQTPLLKIQSGGSGKFNLQGEAEEVDVNFSGSGEYNAGDLQTKRAEISIGGSGKGTLWVSEELDVRISGSGDIRYYGSPRISQSISGSGDVRSLGEK